jgi:hypothetical protein
MDQLSDLSLAFEQYPELRIRILHAQRSLLLELRDTGIYSTGALVDALAIRASAFEQSGGEGAGSAAAG